jgi:hypothetical protein
MALFARENIRTHAIKFSTHRLRSGLPQVRASIRFSKDIPGGVFSRTVEARSEPFLLRDQTRLDLAKDEARRKLDRSLHG